MTISNRAKVLTAGMLIVITIILILLFFKRPQTAEEPAALGETFEVLEDTTPVAEPTIELPTEEQAQAVSAATVAGVFVERFGSYSSESDLANIEDVLPLATDNYAQELEALIEKIRVQGRSDSYYGVTTRVLSKKQLSMDLDAGTAVYEVLTQREESQGSAQDSVVSYQSIRIELKQKGEVWLIDSATWL